MNSPYISHYPKGPLRPPMLAWYIRYIIARWCLGIIKLPCRGSVNGAILLSDVDMPLLALQAVGLAHHLIICCCLTQHSELY